MAMIITPRNANVMRMSVPMGMAMVRRTMDSAMNSAATVMVRTCFSSRAESVNNDKKPLMKIPPYP